MVKQFDKTKVTLLGTLHNQHFVATEYGLDELKTIVKNIKPEVVLAEIPPDRFLIAKQEYDADGRIIEERVSQYPEFSEVIFPLQKKLHFNLIPVSAWTQKIADTREEKLIEISKNPTRTNDWNAYLDAKEQVNELFEKAGFEFTPEWIHSDKFDEILEVELSVFNALFNDDLGAGGWENINKKHYQLINQALQSPEIKGKKVLIIFGAGHKGWFKRKLRKRDDIKLISLLEALE